MLRVLTGLPIMWLLGPGYGMALLLTLSPFPFAERYLFFYSIPQNATSILEISVL